MLEYLLSAEFYQVMLFYVFSGVLLGAALLVVTMRNSVYSALFLILSFFSAAALWMLLEAEFLALTLVLVYVGAVMVLFLFVVMMLDIKVKPKSGMSLYTKTGLFVALLMALEMVMLFGSKLHDSLPQDDLIRHEQGYSNVREVAESIYIQYVLPFELASVILLVAIVAAILLTLRKRKDYKHVDPESQVHVKADKNRMRIVKMKAEKGNEIGGEQ
ncbi:MAG TPA: NADH-quinone oxidoreductase subunit J [Gammaproteobacteria bacterium]|jgi:NADH-quinone oxidoreductase subunit J|nr:NADH-quinone oxidoreductase subunit J [Xanthomonadales bacterium]HOP23180.1 NADH-quinone oxidoreductase subunit J [Gammaproteobacteria bacterium]HPQ86935.1 NADH-quinone oxidoreductase subunit J [Gammaproteobacteria bacterium]